MHHPSAAYMKLLFTYETQMLLWMRRLSSQGPLEHHAAAKQCMAHSLLHVKSPMLPMQILG